jgi:hypothetical protein
LRRVGNRDSLRGEAALCVSKEASMTSLQGGLALWQTIALMKNVLKAVLPSLETFARIAKSAPAKKKLMTEIKQVKEALKAAEQASTLQGHKDRA